jgi:hypothetical protein
MSNQEKVVLGIIGIISTGIILVSLGASGPTPTPSPAPQVEAATTVQERVYTTPTATPIRITPTPKVVIPTQVPLSNNNYYTNTAGNEVHSPVYADSVPIGASAICRDGTYSFSQNRRGTCSHHGGVATWL